MTTFAGACVTGCAKPEDLHLACYILLKSYPFGFHAVQYQQHLFPFECTIAFDAGASAV